MHRYLSNGKSIVFNNGLKAIKTGLEIKGEVLPWDEIGIPGIKNEMLSFQNKPKNEELYKIKIDQIKNLDLLIHLIENPPNEID